MAKYRVSKGKGALKLLRKTLCNTRIAFEYKVMLIKNINIPFMTYGTEKSGMTESNSTCQKTVLDNIIKCILKRSNFCRLRAYEEFDIKPLYVQVATSRKRGLLKWTHSQGLLYELIENQQKFIHEKDLD